MIKAEAIEYVVKVKFDMKSMMNSLASVEEIDAVARRLSIFGLEM